MAKVAKLSTFRTTGEWIARDNGRDGGGWRVRVPVQGGHGYFSFQQYGGSQKALDAARRFHAKACAQLRKDREHFKKTGEKPNRPTVNIRNRSGHTGVSYQIFPVLDGNPTVVYTAYYSNRKGQQISKRFSTADPAYKGHADYALEAAVEWRQEMMKRKR